MASLSPSPTKKSLSQQGQISWYSSVQSSSTFRLRQAHMPIFILRYKKIEQGQLSYPKICPYYLPRSNSSQGTKLKAYSPELGFCLSLQVKSGYFTYNGLHCLSYDSNNPHDKFQT